METKIIKGDSLKDKIFLEVATEVARLQGQYNKTPGITFIGFSGVPLSKYVIPLHVQAAEAAGFFENPKSGMTQPPKKSSLNSLTI